MSTTAIQTTGPLAITEKYAVTVRRARNFLKYLMWMTVAAGVITTLISFLAVNDALGRYQTIVADSAISADAAQSGRSALLAHHSAAADYLSQQGTSEAAQALGLSQQQWRQYQQHVRRVWENRSDQEFGEYAVFEAADNATWRYRGQIDAMVAFVEAGDIERAEKAFLKSHDMLIQEVLPALNGLESLKLESMEEAYATTNADLTNWLQALLAVGGVMLFLLVLGFLLTRFWLHYGWTWEIGLGTLAAILLFAWMNYWIYHAATEVEVLVGNAYDAISGAQSVEALLTQADALESIAIFDPEQANQFLSDADEYLFLLEQRLCGDLDCTNESFLNGSDIAEKVNGAAEDGKGKYGLPYDPLVSNAYDNNFAEEPNTLEALRVEIQSYREANDWLQEELKEATGNTIVPPEQRQNSTEAYRAALQATKTERDIARAEFNGIYTLVTTAMELNRVLALGFIALSALGSWGIRRRRKALFA
ncbi:MAG: hypothetical protein ACPGWR_17340 [Ardenticatenaceae bacterium]